MCTQLAKNPAPDQIGTSRQKLGAQKCTCKSIPEGVREGYAFGCSIGERVTLSVARATSGDRDHPTLTPKLVSTPAQPCATPARCYHGGGGHVISVAWLHNTIGLSLPGDPGGLNMEILLQFAPSFCQLPKTIYFVEIVTVRRGRTEPHTV